GRSRSARSRSCSPTSRRARSSSRVRSSTPAGTRSPCRSRRSPCGSRRMPSASCRCLRTCSATRPRTSRRAARSGSPPSRVAAAPEATPTVAADGRLKILLVEDHQDTAESLAAMLEGWGHEVQVAFDGLAALRAVAAVAPDVVLSDLGLPSLDGYEFARRLRQQPGFGRVLLVALSGYGREEDKR